jgi:maltooligosyltrehalose synthase
VLVVVPRFACTLMKGKPILPLGEAWREEALLLPAYAGKPFLDAFTGERRSVSTEGTLLLREIFEEFPVAVLSSAD